MGDHFRHFGEKDVKRLSALNAVENAWLRACRHNKTESIENEEARARELADAMLKFSNERLGTEWVPRQTPLALLDGLTVVEGAFIDTVLAKALPGFGKGVVRIPMDGKYYLPSQRDAWRIIEWSQVNTIPWQKEQYDCDDHAEALRHDFRSFGVNSCGFVVDWSGGHAYNFIPFADEQYWFLEPQSDRIIAIGAGIYKMERADILL